MDKDQTVDRLQRAANLQDAATRAKSFDEMLREFGEDGGDVEEIVDVVEEIVAAESSGRVLARLWSRLAGLPCGDGVRGVAETALQHHDPSQRRWALHFLGRAFPSERQELFRRLRDDTNPFVLYEAGCLVEDFDPDGAVSAWLDAMYRAPAGLADEVLPSVIGQFISDKELEQMSSMAADDELAALVVWQAGKWRQLVYLEGDEPSSGGAGYFIVCPLCKQHVGVRDGHSGQHARHVDCGHEFSIPAAPADS
jgi:hypothetical protein